MKPFLSLVLLCCLGTLLSSPFSLAQLSGETKAQRDARMQWWREARFGLFIHWGLYAIPAGEWNGKTEYGEWIRTSAQIPLAEYDKFVGRFNPVKFDPDAWVALAKEAGMQYIVITSKHHDGFCLFATKETDFNVTSTPFGRDIMKALADACRKYGMKICWYHSIMDWHHPDYLPRRDWETDRPATGADFTRYVRYLKAELKELLTQYGDIGVLWFDGEWESTWNTAYGRDLYDYVRSLQPRIIVNNRVGAGRSGMEGFSKEGEFAGDFGTPEQEIPATGLPGVDWETCMTMNDHWGYNKHDNNWKSTKDLLRMLADIASKGGNFLLNVGPTAEGLIPQASVDRLQAIGQWMKINGEAIHGTMASPFAKLPWGRCTQRHVEDGTRFYFHVFDWPTNGLLRIPGLLSDGRRAYLLADADKSPLTLSRDEDALIVHLPVTASDPYNSVVVLDVPGKADISEPPTIVAEVNQFVDELSVAVSTGQNNVDLRATVDGSVPSATSPVVTGTVRLTQTTTLCVRAFRGSRPVSPASTMIFTKVAPRLPVTVTHPQSGVHFRYVEGDWDRLPDFHTLTAVNEGTLTNFEYTSRRVVDRFGFEYTGYIAIPKTGVYCFFTDSDDGSRLFIGDSLIVENDGLHGLTERRGTVALEAGMHPIRVTYFDKTGGDGLTVSWSGPGITKGQIPASVLFHEE